MTRGKPSYGWQGDTTVAGAAHQHRKHQRAQPSSRGPSPAPRTTPLLHLVAGGDQPTVLDVAKRLLSEGVQADLVEPEDGLTPLHVACHWDRLAMAQLLLLHGANPLKADYHGRTPLSMATGDTKKFLYRMIAKSEHERRGVFHRIFHLHFGGKLGKALRGAKKRMRRTVGFFTSSGRGRSNSECFGAAIATSTPRPSSAASGDTTGYLTAAEGPPDAALAPPVPAHQRLPPAPPTRRGRASPVPQVYPALPVDYCPIDYAKKPKNRRASAEAKVTKRDKKKKKDKKHKKERAVVIEFEESDEESEPEPHSRPPSRQRDGSRDKSRSRTPDGLRARVASMTDARLRRELRDAGVDAGPMSGNVRRAYERKLIDALKQCDLSGGDDGRATPATGRRTAAATRTMLGSTPATAAPTTTTLAFAAVAGAKFSRPLELAMAGRAWQEATAIAADERIRSTFINRGVTAFCYLLLDPRVLPARAEDATLAHFVQAVFYVGKGTKARPLQHLIDAKRERDSKKPRLTAKLARICTIWDSGIGVVSLQISHNICDEEALTREAALIESIGLHNLSNVKGGKFFGGIAHWQPLLRAQIGTLMLKRARHVLLAEGLRPITPEALPESVFKPPPAGIALRRGVGAVPVPRQTPGPPPGIRNGRR